MREIKFRAWDGERFFYSDSPTADFVFGSKGNGVYEHGHLVFDLTPSNLDEYTGFKDKNGVEIYEGDILENVHSKNMRWRYRVRCYTEFDHNFYGDTVYRSFKTDEFLDEYVFGDFYMDEPSRQSLYTITRTCEVIGNIYENPELLEAQG